MLNNKTVRLKLRRIDVCDLLLATTHIRFDMEDEMKNPETTETRREILKGSIQKWEALHDELKHQLDEFDAAHA